MNPIYHSIVPIIILFIIIIMNRRKTEKLIRIIRNRKKRGIIKMSDVLNRYIGKDCIVDKVIATTKLRIHRSAQVKDFIGSVMPEYFE